MIDCSRCAGLMYPDDDGGFKCFMCGRGDVPARQPTVDDKLSRRPYRECERHKALTWQDKRWLAGLDWHIYAEEY